MAAARPRCAQQKWMCRVQCSALTSAMLPFLAWGCGAERSPTPTATDWLSGWTALHADDVALPNLTSAWSNGEGGSGREWLIVGGRPGGAGTIHELHGTTWRRHTIPGAGHLWWVHGDASGRRMAVGDGGHVLRWRSGDAAVAIAQVPSLAAAGGQLFGVWFAAGMDHAWVVGGHAAQPAAPGILWRVPFAADTGAAIDQTATRVVLAGHQGMLMKVWGADANHVIAVGDGGGIWAVAGGVWTLAARIGDDRFVGVTGRGIHDMIVVGGTSQGTVVRGDASGWRQVAGCAGCGINGNLAAVAVAPDGTALVGGARGYLALQRGAAAAKDLRALDPPLTELDLHGAWLDAHSAVFVGGNLTNPAIAAGTLLVRGDPLPALPP